MPKISDERKEARREQILAGARRCFAEYGYEGATVRRLEEATGLSRGAIFNYFPSKEDVFIELCHRDNDHIIHLWIDQGWEVALRDVAESDPDWVGVYLEASRRMRTDPEFREHFVGREGDPLIDALVAHTKDAQDHGTLRDDVPAARLAAYISLVANGMVGQIASGTPISDVGAVIDFTRAAVEPRDRPRTPPHTPS